MSVLTHDPALARPDSPKPIQFNLNGKSVTVVDELDRSLLGVLREECSMMSLKNGCEPQASCGCCTLMIDGKPRLSCTMKPKQVAGKDLVTLEGLPEETRKMLADSFVNCGGVQCGFCIPGMAMKGHALTNENACPSREVIAHEL